MRTRPRSLTVVAIIAIAFGLLTIVSGARAFRRRRHGRSRPICPVVQLPGRVCLRRRWHWPLESNGLGNRHRDHYRPFHCRCLRGVSMAGFIRCSF